jgi:hypothetical protein
MSEESGTPEAVDAPNAASTLFDLRTVIAVLFGVYGLVLLGIGLWGTDATERAKSGGLNLNLWTGLAMVVLAVLFAAWARLRPVVPPGPAGDGDPDGDDPMHT